MTTAARSARFGESVNPRWAAARVHLWLPARATSRRVAADRVDRAAARWVLTCSALMPALLVAAWLIGDALQPASYSPVRQTVSVLAGEAGTDRWIVTGALYVIGLCYLALAAGLRGLRLPARIGLLAAGISGIGIAACPEPAHGSTSQHAVFTTLGALAIATWPALAGRRLGHGHRLVALPVTLVATAVSLGLLAWTAYEIRNGMMLGLAERLSSSLQICWPFVIACRLRGLSRAPAAASMMPAGTGAPDRTARPTAHPDEPTRRAS